MTKASQVSTEVKNTLPLLPAQFSDLFLKEKYDEVEKEVKAEVFDVTTEDGRKRIKSVAADISKSNKLFDTPMRDHLRELKSLPKVLELTARQSKERFEKLRDGVLEPLKNAQKFQDDLLAWLNNVPINCSAPDVTGETLNFYLAEIEKIDQSTIWKELAKKFKVAIEAAATSATVTLERVEQAEKQAAELEVLRKQKAETEQKESDRLVAEAAAKKATEDAEAKAQKEREDVDRRAADERRAKEDAEHAAKQAIIDKQAAEQKVIDDAEEAKKAAAAALVLAKKQAEDAAALATENERKRIEEEAAEHDRLAKEREADKSHKIKINRAALVVLVAGGVSEDDAKNVIRMIGRGEVPNIAISY